MQIQKITLVLTCSLTVTLSSCAEVKTTANTAKVKQPVNQQIVGTVSSIQYGKASWYSVQTNHGSLTASGERLSNSASTAAHKTLRMGTRVRVTNLANGKSEVVRITDRGPYVKGRIIDVTIGCAQRIGFHSRGVAKVKVEVLNKN
jgi:rare lipoprotein A